MKTKVIVALASILLLIVGIGCSTSLSYLITPADRDKAAERYATETGAADPNDFKGFFNLHKALKLQKAVDVGHVLVQQELDQAKARDNTQHNIHSGSMKTIVETGMAREEALFGPTGLISMGMTLMGVSGVGVLGLMRKRPGDITPQEMQSALAEVKGQTVEELSEKEKQFTQLVKGFQAFVTDHKQNGTNGMGEILERLKTAVAASENPAAAKAVQEMTEYLGTWNGDVILSLKAAMDKYQDTETKNAVSSVKNEMV